MNVCGKRLKICVFENRTIEIIGKIEEVKFKRKVVPGDQLQFEVRLLEPIRRGVCRAEGKAFVGDQLACEAVLMAQVVKNK